MMMPPLLRNCCASAPITKSSLWFLTNICGSLSVIFFSPSATFNSFRSIPSESQKSSSNTLGGRLEKGRFNHVVRYQSRPLTRDYLHGLRARPRGLGSRGPVGRLLTCSHVRAVSLRADDETRKFFFLPVGREMAKNHCPIRNTTLIEVRSQASAFSLSIQFVYTERATRLNRWNSLY